MDPTRLWQQWYAAAWGAPWAGAVGPTPADPGPAGAFADPWGLAALWFPTPAGAPRPSAAPGAGAGTMPNPFDPAALWQWWLNGMLAMLPGAQPPGAQPPPAAMPGGDPQAWLARWQELLRAGAGATTSAGAPLPPPVAWTAFRQWYDVTSGPWSQALDELVSSPAFAEAAGKFLDGYASYMTALRRSAEQFAHALQLPTRADIARVAGLVIALEEKVDGIEQAQEDAAELAAEHAARAAHEPLASSAAVAALDARLTRLEAKLDRLLAAMEPAERAESASGHASGSRGASANGGARATRDDRASSANTPAPRAAASNGSAPRTHRPSTTVRATRNRRQPPGPRTPPAP